MVAAVPLTFFHDVLQRGPEWDGLRGPRVSGSNGELFNLSQYDEPSVGYRHAIGVERKVFSERGRKAMEHGNAYEHASSLYLHVLFEKFRREDLPLEDIDARWIRQDYDINPGYDIPNPAVHSVFTEQQDRHRFGVSLDMRGSVIDCEIKNPVSEQSFALNYLELFSPTYYFQVQWSMAVRGRESMLLFATFYNDECKNENGITTPKFFVLWQVKYDREFIEKLLPFARKLADAIAARDSTFDVNHCAPIWNEFGPYAKSVEYKARFYAHAHRITFQIDESMLELLDHP